MIDMEHKYKVLVAEDEPLILAGLKFYVEEWGYASAIEEAHNGKVALEKCYSFAPDIIVSDIRMPGMDGLTMLQEIRKTGLKTKVIYYSGYAEFEYAREAIRLGAFDYLLKPIIQDKLYEVLDNAAAEIDAEEEQHLEIGRKRERMEVVCEFLWSGSNISFDEFQEDMAIEFPKDQFQVLVLENTSSGQKIITEQIYGSFGDIYYCRIMLGSNKMLLILNVDQALQKEDALKTAELIFGTNLKGGVSRSAGRKSKAAALMEEAEAAFATEELMEETQIVMYQPLNENAGFYKKRILNGIFENDIEKVHGMIGYLWDMMQKEELMLTHIMDIYNELVTLLSEKDPYYEQYEKMDVNYIREVVHTKAEFYLFFMNLIKEKNVEFCNTEMTVDQVIQEIDENYQTELTLSSLCEKYHISISYLSTMIKKKTKHTFTEYLTNNRLEHAKKLLTEGKLTVGEVTELVGYNDYFYFSKLFKKYVGVTPSKYRKMSTDSNQ